ncbi:MAG TPA: thioether cross-link-forming SCIFF peptide maturase, partial [Bacillota bacterium]|nr:thioether cross-link-forming SCIFF peptide maturase [Bacillota bacterium]
DFFGGEPLLGFEAVKKITEYGNEQAKKHGKVIRFTMTTNGALLDDTTSKWLNDNMFNVVLSLDGRKEVNDSMRKYADGSGTYDSIVPEFQKLVAARPEDKSYYVRGTFTRDNLDFGNDVMHMASLGFRELSVEPVTLPDSDPLSIREEDLPAIRREYDRLAGLLLERPELDFFHFCIDLEGGPCVFKRVKGCGAGSEYIAVTPSGEIYPCHQFVGIKQFLLGNIDDGFSEGSSEIRSKFLNTNLYTKKECPDCFAKYFCGGGCAAASFNASGDIGGCYKIGCELERHRLECALYIKAQQANE